MFAALSTTPASLNSEADAVESVRILVVGNAGCGKSTLAHALATGKPPTRPPPQTAGCTVWVRMIDADPDASTSTSTSAPRPLAVELWDIGCARRYAPLRRLFYGEAAGVLLCHDLGTAPAGAPRAGGAGGGADAAGSSARAAAVRPWVAELAAAVGGSGGLGGGGAAAPPASSLAGLPFPAALVGTKADRAGGARKGTPAVLVDAVALGLAGGGWATAASRAWRGLGMSRAASFTRRWSGLDGGGGGGGGGGGDQAGGGGSGGRHGSAGGVSPPPVRPGLTAMHTSALDGDVDGGAFDDFFRRCAAAARGRVGGGGAAVAASSSAAAAWGAAYGGNGGHAVAAISDGLGGDDDDLV